MLASRILVTALIAAILSGCDKKAAFDPPPRPVRAVTVERGASAEIVSVTGQVRARNEANLAFRLEGRVLQRLVGVGDVLTVGQVVARLDPRNQENALRSAEAGLASAEAVLTQARLSYGRQQVLLKDGWTPRAKFDDAQQAFLTAQAQVDSAQAQLRIARDQLGYTVLVADTPGSVTAVGAELGEVVHPGQMVARIARDGGRDAVFDVSEQLVRTGPPDPPVEVDLSNDPRVRATGRVREVAPQADAATRTFQVKVDILNPPDAMRLGATVTGRIRLPAPPGVEVPASALTQTNGHPAVWVVDASSHKVSPRAVEVGRYDPSAVLISQGLDAGELLVTAGVQTLRPGQKVRILGGS